MNEGTRSRRNEERGKETNGRKEKGRKEEDGNMSGFQLSHINDRLLIIFFSIYSFQ